MVCLIQVRVPITEFISRTRPRIGNCEESLGSEWGSYGFSPNLTTHKFNAISDLVFNVWKVSFADMQ